MKTLTRTVEIPVWFLALFVVLSTIDMIESHGWLGLGLMVASAIAGYLLAAWQRTKHEDPHGR